MRKLIVLLAVIFISCKSTKPVTNTTPDQPQPEITMKKTPGLELNGSWELEKLWGSGNKWDVTPSIEFNFENKTFSGNTGCNTMSGSFTLIESFINIDKKIITTKMACSGYNENTFLAILLKINRYMVDNDILELSQNDIVLIRFLKK